jgi:PEGA domain-containing protein
VPRLDELLTELRARLTEVTIRANVSNARVLVRDRVVGTTPFSAPVTLVAGPAVVEILAPGYVTYRREYQLKPGGEVLVDVQLAPADASKPAAAPPVRERPPERGGPGITSRWWFWAGVGAVAVAAGVVTYAALSTERSADRGEFGGPGPIRAPLVTFLLRYARGWRPAGVTAPGS